jgi:hypothetical protein
MGAKGMTIGLVATRFMKKFKRDIGKDIELISRIPIVQKLVEKNCHKFQKRDFRYVGVTLDLKIRLQQHRKQKLLLEDMMKTDYEVVSFNVREKLLCQLLEKCCSLILRERFDILEHILALEPLTFKSAWARYGDATVYFIIANNYNNKQIYKNSLFGIYILFIIYFIYSI